MFILFGRIGYISMENFVNWKYPHENFKFNYLSIKTCSYLLFTHKNFIKVIHATKKNKVKKNMNFS
jgi:hypothetical protein